MSTEDYHALMCKYLHGDKDKMMYPFPYGEWRGLEWVCATDGHALMFVPKSLAHDYPPVANSVNAIKVLPDDNCSIPIDAETLVGALLSVNVLEYPMDCECPDCDGDGQFDYGNHTYECKECKGRGTVKFANKVVKELDRNAIFSWLGTWFSPKEFLRLVKTMQTVNAPVTVTSVSPIKILAKIGEIYTLTCGLVQDELPEGKYLVEIV